METRQEEIIDVILLVCKENKANQPLKKELNMATNLRNDLQLDSLDMAELMVRLEDKFGIDVFEDGIVTTIGEIFNKIN